jgi:hypothetical protein
MPTYLAAVRSVYGDATEVVNVQCLTKDGDDAAGGVDVWNDHLHDLYLAMVPDSATLIDLTVTQVPEFSTDTPTDQAFRIYNEQGTGPESSNTKLSPALCAMAVIYSATRGRRSRGRMWLPPPLAYQEAGDDGTWNTGSGTYMAKCTAFLDEYAGFAADGWTTAIYSRANVAENVDPAAYQTTRYVLSNRQHWIRSREFPAP